MFESRLIIDGIPKVPRVAFVGSQGFLLSLRGVSDQKSIAKVNMGSLCGQPWFSIVNEGGI